MNEEHVKIIRKSTRDLLSSNRRHQRDDEIDKRRLVKKSRVTEENVIELAEKLKTRSQVSATELQMLKNGIMDNLKFIDIILNVHGALRGLIRELTGHNTKKQTVAAACCCNLALGDTRSCMTVAKASGSYLTTELDSLNTELAVTCAWTLGNLAGADIKVCNVLIAQGALSKIIKLLNKNELNDSLLYALEHFAYQMKDELSCEHLFKILDVLTHLDINMESSNLLFLLSCHKEFPNYEIEILLQKLLTLISTTTEEYLICNNYKNCWQLLYILRTLANINRCDVILNYFVLINYSVAVKNILSKNDVIINKSLMWLLGNLFKYNNHHDFFKQILP